MFWGLRGSNNFREKQKEKSFFGVGGNKTFGRKIKRKKLWGIEGKYFFRKVKGFDGRFVWKKK